MIEMEQSKGKWIFISPVSGVIFSDNSNKELKLGEVYLVRGDRLSRVRRRLHIDKKLSEIYFFKEKFLGDINKRVFAVWVTGGKGEDRRKEFNKRVEFALKIVSTMQLMNATRRFNVKPGLSTHRSIGSSKTIYWHCESGNIRLGSDRYDSSMNMIFDKSRQELGWLFFDQLLNILNGKCSINKNWKECILNAASFAGESQGTKDITHAFMWNCIAIEVLIATDAKHRQAIHNVMESLFFWVDEQSEDGSVVNTMDEIYAKRCELVHEGKSDNITSDDLDFTDMVLLNLFHIILTNLTYFKDKSSIAGHVKKYMATKCLGISLGEFERFGFLCYDSGSVVMNKAK